MVNSWDQISKQNSIPSWDVYVPRRWLAIPAWAGKRIGAIHGDSLHPVESVDGIDSFFGESVVVQILHQFDSFFGQSVLVPSIYIFTRITRI